MPDELTTVPQLSPIQQQFVQTLGEAPANAVPFSAGPGLQGFSSPGYAAGYQPAQSFDDPAYQKSLYEWEQEVRRKAEAARAEQAVQAGIRYIYQQRYDADLKKGIPEDKAFARMMLGVAMHTPKTDPVKAFEAFRQPTVVNLPNVGPVVTGQRVQFPPPQIPEGPLQTRPFVTPEGVPIPNRYGYPTRGGVHVLTPEQEQQLTPSQQLKYYDDRIKGLQTERANLNVDEAGEKRRTDLNKEITDLRQKQQELFEKHSKKGGKTETAAPNKLTREQAVEFLKQAGGDKEKARKLAKDAGYAF